MYAPIALFVYARPHHTLRTLEALRRNEEFLESPVFAFCDGARGENDAEAVAEVRKLLSVARLPNLTIIKRERNWGLACSVADGVSTLCQSHGRVVVVEDDLIVAPGFLRYMNQMLDSYEQNHLVMQISGHMFPLVVPCKEDGFFLPFVTTWGWGTWRRAWEKFADGSDGAERLLADNGLRKRFDLDGAYPYSRMLQKQMRGEVDSWGIWWNLSVFLAGGLVLYPRHTLVINAGRDGSGRHHRLISGMRADKECFDPLFAVRTTPPFVVVDPTILTAVRGYLRRQSSKREWPLIFMRKLASRLKSALWK